MTSGQFVLQTRRRAAFVRLFAQSMLEANREDFHSRGANVLLRTVYTEHPESQHYQRTYNMYRSFRTSISKTQAGAVLVLYLEPSEELQSLYEGEYDYYPSYVVQGRFFGQQHAHRPVVERWINEVGALVLEKARDYIDHKIVRIL